MAIDPAVAKAKQLAVRASLERLVALLSSLPDYDWTLGVYRDVLARFDTDSEKGGLDSLLAGSASLEEWERDDIQDDALLAEREMLERLVRSWKMYARYRIDKPPEEIRVHWR